MLKRIIIILGIGLLYYGFVKWTGIYIPCIFYERTGFVCPGCGISHLCSDLLSFQFQRAFFQNVGISIIIIIYILWCILRYGFRLSWCNQKNEHYLMLFFIIFLIGYGILRNLPGFEWLLPYYMQ